MTAGLIAALLALCVGGGLAPSALASHGEPLGANFGVAESHNNAANDPLDEALDVDAPAFPPFTPPGWPRPKAFWMGVCDLEAADTGGSGIGSPPPIGPLDCIDHGTAYTMDNAANPDPPRETTWMPGQEPSWRLDSLEQAGAHPDVTASFWLNRYPDSPTEFGSTHSIASDGDVKDVTVKLPPGFLGDPNAVPRCAAEKLATSPPSCPPETQVGVSTITLGEGGLLPGTDDNTPPSEQRVPVWNVEPRDGKLAEFVLSANISAFGRVTIPIVAKARTDGDFGIDTMAVNLQSGLPLLGQTITFWGTPWDESHDKYRPPTSYDADTQEGIPEAGFPDATGNQPQRYRPEWGPLRPFIVAQTECSPTAPATTLELESWHDLGNVKSYVSPLDEPKDGCEKLDFDPSLDIDPTTTTADAPSGLDADLEIPQNLDPRDSGGAPLPTPPVGASQSELDAYVAAATDYWRSDEGLATSQLRDAVVTLPEGMALNPSAASGLQGCSDALIGLTALGPPAVFTDSDPFDMSKPASQRCPNGSRIGTVEVYSPAIPADEDDVPGEPNISGDVVIGTPRPGDVGAFDQDLTTRLFLVLRNRERGLVAKIAGVGVNDADTGRITATFAQSPRVPFETMRLQLRGGSRGVLATAPKCGASTWSGLLTPWTAAHGAGGTPDPVGGAFGPTTRCSGGFAPSLSAGTDNPAGGGSGVFSFELSRPDGQQWVRGLTARLPAGLLADVGSVPLCANAQAAVGACPLASKVGTVDAASGAGTPFVLEKKGAAYLTQGYKGAPYGLATVIPVEAGPFRGQFALDTIVVRQALYVDRRTAVATVVSDPFPIIHHGIPLRLRRATLLMDRPGFVRNPTSCAQKAVTATFTSVDGATSSDSFPFRASGCKRLRFRPKLSLTLTGRRQTRTNGHPGIKAKVKLGSGQAAIRRAEVRLPQALVLDIDNADALCEFKEGIKDEPNCPAGSVVGRARAVSPLLSKPLAGKVYFVKNVRIDQVTGRERRTLPMIIVALRGEIAVNLRGESDVRGGRLISTFTQVPDAPVTSFNLNIEGGRNGILKVTANRRGNIDICKRKQTAEAYMDGHNRKAYDREIKVKTPCKKAKAKKRKAKRRKR